MSVPRAKSWLPDGPLTHCSCLTAMTAALLLSGTHAGVGKTTVAAGLASALRGAGLHVEQFRIGPDLEDLSASSQGGPPAINLDSCLLQQEQLLACYHTYAAGADLSIIEGCCGLFDAASADGSEQGSTAQVAKWLGVPVVLVVDCAANSSARGIAVLLRGYTSFDAELQVAGLLLNRVSGPSQVAELQDGLAMLGCSIPVLGGVPKVDDGWSSPVPDWHSTASATSTSAGTALLDAAALGTLVGEGVDLAAMQNLAATARTPQPAAGVVSPRGPAPRAFRAALGVARDEAFCRYYQHNLTLLTSAGVQLVPFSPIRDGRLPPGLSGVLLGGGPAHRWAHHLAANGPMLAALRAFAAAGGLVWAEGSGVVYVSQSLTTGMQQHVLAGLLPFRTRTVHRRSNTPPACVSIRVQQGCPVLPEGAHLRGCTHHCIEVVTERILSGLTSKAAGSSSSWSSSDVAALETGPQAVSGSSSAESVNSSSIDEEAAGFSHTYAATLEGASGTVLEGYTRGTVLASAVHVHLGSCPGAVQHLLQRCLRVDVAGTTSAAAAAAASAAAAEMEAAAAAAAAAAQHGLSEAGRTRSLGAQSLPDLSVAVMGPSSSSKGVEPESPSSSSWQYPSSLGRHSSGVAKSISIPSNLQHMTGPRRSHLAGGAQPEQPRGQQSGGGFAVPQRFSMDLGRYSSVLAPPGAVAPHPGPTSATGKAGSSSGSSHGGARARGGEGSSHRGSSRGGALCGEADASSSSGGSSLPDPLAHLLQQQLTPLGATTHSKGIGLACPLTVTPDQLQQDGGVSASTPGQKQGPGSTGMSQGSDMPSGAAGVQPASSVYQHMTGLLQQRGASVGAPNGTQQQQAPGTHPAAAVDKCPAAAAQAGAAQQQQVGVVPHDKLLLGGSGGERPLSAAPVAVAVPAPSGHRRTWSLDHAAPAAVVAADRLPLAAETGLSGAVGSRPHSTSPGWRPSGGGGATSALGGAIVSLCPAATDVLLGLGLGARLAAVTEEDLTAASGVCPGASSSSGNSGSTGALGSSGCTKASVVEAATVVCQTVPGSAAPGRSSTLAWQMDEEALRSLRPHLILAPGEEQSPATPGMPAGPTAAGARPAFTAALAQKALKRVGALWPESGVTVLFQQCSTLADVVEFMRVVAQAAGADDAGRAALEELQRRLRAVAAAVRTTAAPQRRWGLPRTSSGARGAAQVQQPHGARAPRVLVLSSVTPLQVAGQWVPELLQLASGWGPQPHWVPEPGEPCAQVTWATLRSWAPEVLVLALPHCSAAAAALETPQLAGQPGWWGIPAVAAGAVYAVDEALLCRPGPGLVAGVELLAHLLWPQRVPAPTAAAGLVLRLSLHSGQRCRARLVPNYFSPLC